MKLYKHVYNVENGVKTVEFEVTETPKLYKVLDTNFLNGIWERQIKKEDVGKFTGNTIRSYSMITITPNATPFIKELIKAENKYMKYLKEQIDVSVYRKTQLLKLLEEDADDVYDNTTINCPVCGKEIAIEFDTARCDNCDWSASDADLYEIMNED